MKRTFACRTYRAFGVAVVLSFLSISTSASAQTARGFAVDRFDPSERGSEWFAADSLDLRGALRPAVGVVGSWSHDPLVLYNPDGSRKDVILGDQFNVHAGGSLVLADRLRIAFDLPLMLYANGNGGTLDGVTYPPPSSPAVGDLRLSADVRLLGVHDDLLTVAAGAVLQLPTGSPSGFTGDGSARISGRVLAAGRVGLFVYAASIAIEYRNRNDSFGGTQLGSELPFNVSAGVKILDDRLIVGPEIFGRTTVNGSQGAFDTNDTPLEGIIGAHYLAADAWRFGGGVGTGLTRGLGAPDERFLLSVEWAPAPAKPEPPPEPPPAAVPPTPPPPDADGDHVVDADDACPAVAGVATQDPKTNGCPPPAPDHDTDGIADAEDACPDVAGVKTGDPKTNGCPADTDGDGIADAEDACPKEAGPHDADPKRNGCPRAILRQGKIRILDQVKFRTGSAELDPASDPVLEAVRAVLDDHPEVKKIRVEGHTDNKGVAAANKALSEARAASVVAWLAHHGVDASRLSSQGFGQAQPIDSNRTEDGRRNNRRVEFTVVDAPAGAPATLTP